MTFDELLVIYRNADKETQRTIDEVFARKENTSLDSNLIADRAAKELELGEYAKSEYEQILIAQDALERIRS